jgi:hypothetical protein
MLSALLSQIGTQLSSKRFLLGTVLPLFLFLFGNGWMVWLHYQPFRGWLTKIDGLKDGSIVATVLLTLVFVLAYALSSLSPTLLECLEGKRGPFAWIRWPLYRWEQAKLQSIKRQYDEIALTKVLLDTESKPETLVKALKSAEAVGVAKNRTSPKWKNSERARHALRIIKKYHYGRDISYAELKAGFTGLCRTLRKNSTAQNTKPSKALKKALEEFQKAIFFARDYSQFRRVELYNKRQFNYPGDMEENNDASPQNVLYPTAMGNIGSTMRSYSITRYSLDLDVLWSRLQNCIQSDAAYFGVLQDAKVQLDFLVALAWFWAIFAILWTPVAYWQGSVPEFLAVGSTGFLSIVFYSLACKAYLVFADLVRGGVDLFRFKLASSQHLALPGSLEEERLFWTRLGNLIGYSRNESFSYKHPTAP